MIQLTEEKRSGWCVVGVRGRADADAADQLETALRNAVENCSKVAADFAGLDYISSAGLGVLLAAQKRLSQRGQSLKLINVNHHIRDVFRFSGFDQIFEIA